MKKIITLLSLLTLFTTTTVFADAGDRVKAAGAKATGSVQESMGEATNNPDLINKGKLNKTKGNLLNLKEDAKNTITNN